MNTIAALFGAAMLFVGLWVGWIGPYLRTHLSGGAPSAVQGHVCRIGAVISIVVLLICTLFTELTWHYALLGIAGMCHAFIAGRATRLRG